MISAPGRVLLLSVASVMMESNFSSRRYAEKSLCRASELPIYSSEEETEPEVPTICVCEEEVEEELPDYLENAVTQSKVAYEQCAVTLDELKEKGEHSYKNIKENVKEMVSYLREEDNFPQRMGAIGLGTLIGLLFGLRGGLIKKTLYASTGALGMAAVCYPEEFQEYTQAGMEQAKNLREAITQFTGSESEVLQEENSDTNQTTAEVQDPLEIITKSRDTAISKSCHCPIGACLGHPENETVDSRDNPDDEQSDAKISAAAN